jgi:ATP-dependent RNA helicase RhlE
MLKKKFSKSDRPKQAAKLKSSAPVGIVKKVGKYAYDASYDRFAEYVPKTVSTDSYSDRSSAPRSTTRPSYGSRSSAPAGSSYGDRDPRPSFGGGSRFGGSSSGSRGGYGASSSSPRPSYGGDSRPAFGSRPSYGSRSSAPAGSSYGDRDSRPSFGSSRGSTSSYAPRSGGYSSTTSYGANSSSSRGGYGDRSSAPARSPSYGDRDSRPSFGGGSRFGGSRGGFSGGSRFGGRSSGGGGRSFSNPNLVRGPQGQVIDISKFVNKAEVASEVEVYVPQHSFADFAVEESLKENVVSKGYVTPSPIQDKSIPCILEGRDIVGIANTGTGKTAAFLIPLIDKVLKNPKQQVLIMAPTRELAIQIDEEFRIFAKGLNLYSVCCVGGEYIGKQLRELKYFNNFIIGTPGRLKDLIERGRINLATFNSVVLDEADRMLDMGFINDMRYIMNLMPNPRHTLFFSATLSTEIEKLIHEFLDNPVRISVKTRDTSKNVDQDIVRTEGRNKIDVLHDLLKQADFSKVLIFGRTKHGVEKIGIMLEKLGIKVASIHGDKNHVHRQRALKMFKENAVQALIATDVAARGLDIPNVTHVINFELPQSYEDYVHRIGRTGRGGKSGKALTFID